ncbi:hypothetical protein [Paenibacillus swuensis]|uniref:hypothetical protein n=1 Tax=Paenibacillus swuensis TaxID=1178515 RepID=UPI0012FB9330|nr:hypothetical protein [Paenibacillus swuensis]
MVRFEDWGTPQVAHLDDDGYEELIIHFEGLHTSGPDVSLYRWNGAKLERSETIRNALGISNKSWNSVTLDRQTQQLKIATVVDSQSNASTETIYVYDNGKFERTIP